MPTAEGHSPVEADGYDVAEAQLAMRPAQPEAQLAQLGPGPY
jgi:hypothetical protein